MKTNEQIIENLTKAKEYLQENGRTVGTLYDPSTKCACLLGGVGIAVLGDDFKEVDEDGDSLANYDPFYRGGPAYEEVVALAKVANAIRGKIDDLPDLDVWRFNDNHAGRGEDGDKKVFDLIDRTIESLRSAA